LESNYQYQLRRGKVLAGNFFPQKVTIYKKNLRISWTAFIDTRGAPNKSNLRKSGWELVGARSRRHAGAPGGGPTSNIKKQERGKLSSTGFCIRRKTQQEKRVSARGGAELNPLRGTPTQFGDKEKKKTKTHTLPINPTLRGGKGAQREPKKKGLHCPANRKGPAGPRLPVSPKPRC